MDKHEFDRAIGEVPPSTVDVDGIVARERRAAWVRRAANPWVATAAAVVAIAFGVGAVLLPSGSGAGSVPPGSPPATPTSGPPEQISPCARMMVPTASAAPEQPGVAANRLTAVLTAAVRSHLENGAELVANPAAEYPAGTPHGPLEFFHVFSELEEDAGGCRGGEDYFMARANVLRSGAKGNVSAVVGRLGGNASPMAECPPPGVAPPGQPQPASSCDRTSGPNGEVIVAGTDTLEGGPTTNRVDVTKTDGTGIILIAENVADDGKKGGPAETPAPPLSLQQLIAIALDSGMTLYPTP